MNKTYPVISQIKHDGKLYVIGKQIELTDEQAERLKKVGAVEDVAVAASVPGAAPAAAATVPAVPAVSVEPAERIAAIVAAIGKLNVDGPDLWTSGGSPKTSAIEAVTGWQLSAKERDAAWAQINPAQ